MNLATLLLALALPVWTESAGGPVMLDFSAEWCGPCRQMRPAVDQLVRKGYPIKLVDIDENPDLAERYQVRDVPTFVVIDPESGRELARTSGAQPAAQLAGLYQQARAKFEAAAVAEEVEEDGAEAAEEPTAAASPNPKPWETVVRIKVHGQGAIGFGSGTIVHSTPEESIILTCAHIFKLEGRAQAPPSRFPRRITVDLFDGKLSGYNPAQVHYLETVPGEAIDYDFARDVGLIRIKPGRRLPYARVVPKHWQPRARMRMVTVGCSEGHDATAWNTVILNPEMKGGIQGNGAYEAIECAIAPKQGRSGGGLFTDDGYVAGVCDFAEPRGNRGLYATPNSIYSILDRNNLMALYAPVESLPGSGRLLASNRGGRPAPSPSRREAPAAEVARAQSPDLAATADRALADNGPGRVTLPPPEMLGIRPPIRVSSRGAAAAQPEADGPPATRRSAWLPKGAIAADLQVDAALDTDRFGTVDEEEGRFETERPAAPTRPAQASPKAPETTTRKPAQSGWRPGRSALPSLAVGTPD